MRGLLSIASSQRSSSRFLILSLLFPLALSQFHPSYSYGPFYRTQTSAFAPTPASSPAAFFNPRFTSFKPYTSFPSVNYLHPPQRNQGLENVFSSYRSVRNRIQRNRNMFPTFQTQSLVNQNQRRGYSRNFNKPKSKVAPKQAKIFYPDQPGPSLTPSWQVGSDCEIWSKLCPRPCRPPQCHLDAL